MMLIRVMMMPATASSANELARAVHGPVEFGLLGYLGPPFPGIGLVDEPCIEVRVDAHLLPGHGIQGEPGCHFGDSARTFGDHHEVDHHEDDEDHDSHGGIASHHKGPEALDDVAGRQRAAVAVEKNQPGGGDVQRQPEKRGDQEQGGKHGKVQGSHRIDGEQKNHDAEGDVECEKDVQDRRGKGNDHDHENGHDAHGDAHIHVGGQGEVLPCHLHCFHREYPLRFLSSRGSKAPSPRLSYPGRAFFLSPYT